MSTYQKKILAVFSALVLIILSGCAPLTPPIGDIGTDDIGTRIVEGGVRFSLYEPDAKKVHVVGDFNNWSTIADPLYDHEGNGLWSIVIPLPPGRYEYKFLLDGEKWVPDPSNPQRVNDGFGGVNSVLVVEEQ